MLRILGLSAALLAMGCGGGDEVPNAGCGGGVDASPAKEATAAPTPVCEAGKVEACPCAGTPEPGTQVCADDGSKWGECACPDPVETSPAELCLGNLTDADTIASKFRCQAPKLKQRQGCPKLTITNGTCEALSTFFCCVE